MIKGLQVALAILLYSNLPGIVATASAQELSVLPKNNIRTTCTLPPYALLSSLKTAHLTTYSNGSSLFVPAVFTSAKESNGSLTASIGVGVADPEVPIEATPEPIIGSTSAVPSPTAEGMTTPSGGGLDAEAIFNMVNAHRVQIGLPPFQKDGNLSQVAQSRTPELQGEMYGGGGMHAGFYKRHLPYWATENMISQNTEEAAVNWWLNSPVHRSAIEGNYTSASVACQGNNCAMIFSSFVPKSE